jgi:hypothetical protein
VGKNQYYSLELKTPDDTTIDGRVMRIDVSSSVGWEDIFCTSHTHAITDHYRQPSGSSRVVICDPPVNATKIIRENPP